MLPFSLRNIFYYLCTAIAISCGDNPGNKNATNDNAVSDTQGSTDLMAGMNGDRNVGLSRWFKGATGVVRDYYYWTPLLFGIVGIVKSYPAAEVNTQFRIAATKLEGPILKLLNLYDVKLRIDFPRLSQVPFFHIRTRVAEISGDNPETFRSFTSNAVESKKEGNVTDIYFFIKGTESSFVMIVRKPSSNNAALTNGIKDLTYSGFMERLQEMIRRYPNNFEGYVAIAGGKLTQLEYENQPSQEARLPVPNTGSTASSPSTGGAGSAPGTGL